MQVMSAHQMGTARMGSASSSSVVDTSGESWDVAGAPAVSSPYDCRNVPSHVMALQPNMRDLQTLGEATRWLRRVVLYCCDASMFRTSPGVWRAGLYCCDASVFPTSTGVNPMITVEAVAHMIASGIAAKNTHRSVSVKDD